MNEEKKTADLTLEDQLLKAGVSKFACNVASCKGVILAAMETYATQQTAALTTEVTELKGKVELLGELLKNHLETVNADINIMRNCIEDTEHDDVLAQAEIYANKLTEALTACGINL